jgi:hypothetical protein
LELFVRIPARQRRLVQPPCELRVASDRFASVRDAKTNQRSFWLIAQVSKELNYDALLARAASEKVVDFNR